MFCLFRIPFFHETSKTKHFAKLRKSETVKRFAKQWNSLQQTSCNKVKSHEISSTALCPLYIPLSPLRPSASSTALLRPSTSLQLSTPFMDLCSLLGRLSPLRPSVSCSALFSPYGPLSPLQTYVPSTALCQLYGPLSPLTHFVPSTALCPLYGHLPPVCPLLPFQPPIPSIALFPLCDLLFPLRPFIPSTRHVFSHSFTKCR